MKISAYLAPSVGLLVSIGSFVGCGSDDVAPLADAGPNAEEVAAPDAGRDGVVDAAPEDDGAPPDPDADAEAPPPSVPRYVYLSHGYGITIGAITDPATGAYRAIGEVPYGAQAKLLRSPNGKILVSAQYGELEVFTIEEASGFLTRAPSSPGASIALTSAVFSPDGILFAGLGDNDTIRAYTIDPVAGALTQVGNSVATGPYLDDLVVTGNGKFLYALSSSDLYGYSVAANGVLAPLAGFPVDLGKGNGAMELRADPTGRFVALSFAGPDEVAIYKVDATTGALSPVPGSPYPAAGGPWGGAFSRDGRIFYLPCTLANLIRGFALDPVTGAITDAPGSPYQGVANPRSIEFDDAGTVAYVTRTLTWVGDASVSSLSVAADGSLTKQYESRVSGVTPEAAAVVSGPKPVTFKPNYVYALVPGNAGGIRAYAMDPLSGGLTDVPNGTVSVDRPFQAVVDPRGQYLYVISTDALHAYQIDAAGALTELGAAVAVGSAPRSLDISKSGKYLYVGLAGAATIDIYSVDDQGRPSASVVGTRTTPNDSPRDVRFDGVGRQLWSAGVDSVAIYNRQYEGSFFFGLKLDTGSQGTGGLLAFSLDGRNAYVPVSGENKVLVYTNDNVNMPTPLDSYDAGTSPHGVAVDPFGRFVYATDSGPTTGSSTSHAIVAFSRDTMSGALSSIGAFTSLERPFSAAVDPSGKFLVVAATGTTAPTKEGGLSVLPIEPDGRLGVATNITLSSGISWVTIVPTWK